MDIIYSSKKRKLNNLAYRYREKGVKSTHKFKHLKILCKLIPGHSLCVLTKINQLLNKF